jgi:hypothetical protein
MMSRELRRASAFMQIKYGHCTAGGNSMTERDLYADVGGLREWQRASVQQKGEPVEQFERV